MRLKRADTQLAKWLADAMGRWVDPDLSLPGLSQNRLAQLSNVSQSQLHEILKKGHSPRPETLNRLARFFEVNPLVLYRLAYLEEEIT